MTRNSKNEYSKNEYSKNEYSKNGYEISLTAMQKKQMDFPQWGFQM